MIASYFSNGKLRQYVSELASRVRFDSIIVFSTPMGAYAPEALPLLFDMVDVDSEKWIQYARMRSPAFAYRWEAERLRALEVKLTRRAQTTYLATRQEQALLDTFRAGGLTEALENGVELD